MFEILTLPLNVIWDIIESAYKKSAGHKCALCGKRDNREYAPYGLPLGTYAHVGACDGR